jgi:hypothetical protein
MIVLIALLDVVVVEAFATELAFVDVLEVEDTTVLDTAATGIAGETFSGSIVTTGAAGLLIGSLNSAGLVGFLGELRY